MTSAVAATVLNNMPRNQNLWVDADAAAPKRRFRGFRSASVGGGKLRLSGRSLVRRSEPGFFLNPAAPAPGFCFLPKLQRKEPPARSASALSASAAGGGEGDAPGREPPFLEPIYAACEGSAGSRLWTALGVPGQAGRIRMIEKWDPWDRRSSTLSASLPTGASAEAPARVPEDVKIVDIGGDHRCSMVGLRLADVWPAQIEGQVRVANPGCYPAAALNALMLPLIE